MGRPRTFVAGHRGLVGSALVRSLTTAGDRELVLRTRAELDLLDQRAVEAFLAAERPDEVYLAAAKVGGIHANNVERFEFLAQNLAIATNLITAAHRYGTPRLLFLGSSCIYPRLCPQPMAEEHLLTGPLEPTNEPYAIAKIAGVKLVESSNRQHGTRWMSAMPTNLYGPGDNYDLSGSHVLPAMLRKFHEAKVAGDVPVTLWGSGSPRREFLHADDLAAACRFVLERFAPGECPHDLVNVGSGEEVTIRDLAGMIREAVGHRGEVVWDSSKPDGTPRKLLDSARLRERGWRPRISLGDGIAATYRAFLAGDGRR
jgi:GDP-L-fucose synthase